MSIDIALIDSGINPAHPHVRDVAGGCGFILDPEGRAVAVPDFSDTVGHGTAIAGVLLEKGVDVRVYALKIFHKTLYAPASSLLASLKWAIAKNMKMIHLSLGTESSEHKRALEDLCRIAWEKNIVIVAAARSPDDQIFPSVFDTVIGAYWHKACDPDDLIYHPDSPVEFGAHGYPRQLPGLAREMNFSGSSFAAARVTAMAARLMEKNPGHTATELKSALADMANPPGD